MSTAPWARDPPARRIKSEPEGFDLYSRKVIGWDMGTTLHRDFTLNALRMAQGQRSFIAGDLLHHSDRGYASSKYRQLLYDNGIVDSKRLHSHNGYATPAAVEREYAKAHNPA